jgi:membrane protein
VLFESRKNRFEESILNELSKNLPGADLGILHGSCLAAAGKWFGNLLRLPEVALQGLNLMFSLVVITALFALIFKVLPDAHISWRDVWVGAALTAILFTIGKFAIGLYLGKSNVGSRLSTP